MLTFTLLFFLSGATQAASRSNTRGYTTFSASDIDSTPWADQTLKTFINKIAHNRASFADILKNSPNKNSLLHRYSKNQRVIGMIYDSIINYKGSYEAIVFIMSDFFRTFKWVKNKRGLTPFEMTHPKCETFIREKYKLWSNKRWCLQFKNAIRAKRRKTTIN